MLNSPSSYPTRPICASGSAMAAAASWYSESEPAGQDESDEQIWAVNGFVFQQPVPSHAPSPVLLVFGGPHVQLTSIWLGADRPQPKSHGPPVGSPSGLRAPPAFLPTFA